MKILIADKLAPSALADLEALGGEVRSEPDLKAEDLPTAIGDAEVLVVRSTKVSGETVRAGKSLALIIRAGAGVNTIDLATASQEGVYVCNCPGKNTAAVAELAVGLMIAADRRIADATQALRDGKWMKKEFGKAAGLRDQTVGILGLGAIGRAFATAAQGLHMNVAAWSRSLTRDQAEDLRIEYAATPEELVAQSDIVSIHMAMSPETRHFVNDTLLSKFKANAILVNTSRGDLVDTDAVRQAIAAGRLRYATDVFENEPESGEADFADVDLAKAVTCTPHIGASTDQASNAIASEVVRIVQVYAQGGPPPGAVNLCQKSPATHSLVVRHFNRVGVLAKIMDGLRHESVNIEEMENVIFDGALAACCSLQLDQPPSPELIEDLKNDDSILAVTLSPAN